jgi:hypothetical protein
VGLTFDPRLLAYDPKRGPMSHVEALPHASKGRVARSRRARVNSRREARSILSRFKKGSGLVIAHTPAVAGRAAQRPTLPGSARLIGEPRWDPHRKHRVDNAPRGQTRSQTLCDQSQ